MNDYNTFFCTKSFMSLPKKEGGLGLKHSELTIYAFLFSFYNKNNETPYYYGTLDYIVKKTGLGKTTVYRALTNLEKKNLIVKEYWQHANYKVKHPQYKIIKNETIEKCQADFIPEEMTRNFKKDDYFYDDFELNEDDAAFIEPAGTSEVNDEMNSKMGCTNSKTEHMSSKMECTNSKMEHICSKMKSNITVNRKINNIINTNSTTTCTPACEFLINKIKNLYNGIYPYDHDKKFTERLDEFLNKHEMIAERERSEYLEYVFNRAVSLDPIDLTGMFRSTVVQDKFMDSFRAVKAVKTRHTLSEHDAGSEASETAVTKNMQNYKEKLFFDIWKKNPDVFGIISGNMKRPQDFHAFFQDPAITERYIKDGMTNFIHSVKTGATERKYIPRTFENFILNGTLNRYQKPVKDRYGRYTSHDSFDEEKRDEPSGKTDTDRENKKAADEFKKMCLEDPEFFGIRNFNSDEVIYER